MNNLGLRYTGGMTNMPTTPSVQDQYAPHNQCFGCGPANVDGLRIKSHVADDGLICHWQPSLHHQAFPGVLNGGIIGAILDCHMNWTAAMALMKSRLESHPPCTVTASFAIELKRPTPLDCLLLLKSQIVNMQTDRAVVSATLEFNGQIGATGKGMFVAVKEGHPAFHRW